MSDKLPPAAETGNILRIDRRFDLVRVPADDAEDGFRHTQTPLTSIPAGPKKAYRRDRPGDSASRTGNSANDQWSWIGFQTRFFTKYIMPDRISRNSRR